MRIPPMSGGEEFKAAKQKTFSEGGALKSLVEALYKVY